MSGYLLADTLADLERALTNSELNVTIIDRIGPLFSMTPEQMLDRGVLVRSDRTRNLGQYRDQELARVEDEITVECGYRIIATKQKESRVGALLLEEQIRALMTGVVPGLGFRMTYTGTPSRGLHPQDAMWWVSVQTFTTARDAPLGGA